MWDSVWVLGCLVWGGSIGVCFRGVFGEGVWDSGAVGVEYEMWLIIGLDKIWRGDMMSINPAINFLEKVRREEKSIREFFTKIHRTP